MVDALEAVQKIAEKANRGDYRCRDVVLDVQNISNSAPHRMEE